MFDEYGSGGGGWLATGMTPNKAMNLTATAAAAGYRERYAEARRIRLKGRVYLCQPVYFRLLSIVSSIARAQAPGPFLARDHR